MTRKRRTFGAAFKAKVALAAAKGDRTTAQLASEYGVHAGQVTAWKKQLMEQVTELFTDGRKRRSDEAANEHELYEQIGLTGFPAAEQHRDEGHLEGRRIVVSLDALAARTDRSDDSPANMDQGRQSRMAFPEKHLRTAHTGIYETAKTEIRRATKGGHASNRRV